MGAPHDAHLRYDQFIHMIDKNETHWQNSQVCKSKLNKIRLNTREQTKLSLNCVTLIGIEGKLICFFKHIILNMYSFELLTTATISYAKFCNVLCIWIFRYDRASQAIDNFLLRFWYLWNGQYHMRSRIGYTLGCNFDPVQFWLKFLKRFLFR